MARIKSDAEVRRVYRKAREVDMEKYNEAKAKEQETMIRSRQIAKDLGLNMKIGDVEYQGDGNKAIFYYIADGRVDFRQLIKVLAEVFRVRIEMKQIGKVHPGWMADYYYPQILRLLQVLKPVQFFQYYPWCKSHLACFFFFFLRAFAPLITSVISCVMAA